VITTQSTTLFTTQSFRYMVVPSKVRVRLLLGATIMAKPSKYVTDPRTR
jgi:hypothetical protein